MLVPEFGAVDERGIVAAYMNRVFMDEFKLNIKTYHDHLNAHIGERTECDHS